MNLFLAPSILSGTLTVPPSKSISHRYLICAGLAEGLSTIYNIKASDDVLATIHCLKALGAKISLSKMICQVQGASLPFPGALLNAGESGSTLRFLLPVAALSNQKMTFLGQPGLLSRPMGVYADLFLSQNLLFEQSSSEIIVQGPLESGLFTLPGEISSQFVSGLLFATPLMKQESEIAIIPPYHSKSYVNLTLSALKTFGIEVERLSKHGYRVPGGQSYKPQDVTVEGDYSSLSVFAIYAALKNALSFLGLKEESEQGDQIVLSILEEAGAEIRWSTGISQNQDENGSQLLEISPKAYKPITVDLADCPDLAPALFVLASFLEGESLFLHTSRLAYKESNRIESMKAELEKFGVKMRIEEDQVMITGKAHYDLSSISKSKSKPKPNTLSFNQEAGEMDEMNGLSDIQDVNGIELAGFNGIDADHIVYDNRFADLFDTSATLDNQEDFDWLSEKVQKAQDASEDNTPVIRIESHNDHRIVMAMAIFALINESPVEIENAQVVSKSYPDFFEDLKKLGADLRES